MSCVSKRTLSLFLLASTFAGVAAEKKLRNARTSPLARESGAKATASGAIGERARVRTRLYMRGEMESLSMHHKELSTDMTIVEERELDSASLSYGYGGKGGKGDAEMSYEYSPDDGAPDVTYRPGEGTVTEPGTATDDHGFPFPVVVMNRVDVESERLDEFLALADVAIETSRGAPKNVLYDVFRALEDQGIPPGSSNTFIFYEIWEDLDGFNQNVQSPGASDIAQFFATGGANLTNYMTDGWNVTKYRTAPSAGDEPFISVAIADVNPDRMDEFMALTEASIAGSRQEESNLYWDVLKSPGDPNRWYFIEAYANPDGFWGDHQSQPYTTEFNEFIGGGGYTNNIWIVTEGYDMQDLPPRPAVSLERADVPLNQIDTVVPLLDANIAASRDAGGQPKTILYDVSETREGAADPTTDSTEDMFFFYGIFDDTDGFEQNQDSPTATALQQAITSGGGNLTLALTEGWDMTTDAKPVPPGATPLVNVVWGRVAEGFLNDYYETFFAVARGARSEEGNLRFDVLRSVENPDEFWLYEVYLDQDAVDHHFAQTWTAGVFEFIERGGYEDFAVYGLQGYDME